MKVRSLESVQFSSYVSFCNVLHICNIRVIPTYRVYRLYDYTHNMRIIFNIREGEHLGFSVSGGAIKVLKITQFGVRTIRENMAGSAS